MWIKKLKTSKMESHGITIQKRPNKRKKKKKEFLKRLRSSQEAIKKSKRTRTIKSRKEGISRWKEEDT